MLCYLGDNVPFFLAEKNKAQRGLSTVIGHITFHSSGDCIYDSGSMELYQCFPVSFLYIHKYLCVTVIYSIHYSNILYKFAALKQ